MNVDGEARGQEVVGHEHAIHDIKDPLVLGDLIERAGLGQQGVDAVGLVPFEVVSTEIRLLALPDVRAQGLADFIEAAPREHVSQDEEAIATERVDLVLEFRRSLLRSVDVLEIER